MKKSKLSISELKKYSKELGDNIPKKYRNEVYRKGLHLSSLWIPALIYFGGTTIASLVFAMVLIGDLLLEYGNYRRWHWARLIFRIFFAFALRSKEDGKSHFTATGGAYLLCSSLICTLIFSNPVATIAITVLLISDALAALIGKACGQRKLYREKTLEGSTAFFMSALIIMMLFNPIYTFSYVSVIACFVAVIAELYEGWFEMDDNFAVPLSIGAVLTFMG